MLNEVSSVKYEKYKKIQKTFQNSYWFREVEEEYSETFVLV